MTVPVEDFTSKLKGIIGLADFVESLYWKYWPAVTFELVDHLTLKPTVAPTVKLVFGLPL